MNRKELVDKLYVVSHALAGNDIIPIFKCFVFTGETVYAYNDGIGIVAPCQTETPFAVNGKTLLGLLEASSGDDVDFTTGDECVVRTGRSTFTLPLCIEDPLFKEPRNGWKATVLTKGLLPGLEACLLTSSRDLTQQALLGVAVRGGTQLNLYSSDGDAITKYSPECTCPPGQPDVVLPNEFCEALISLDEAVRDTDDTNFSKEWVRSRAGQFVIYGRVIEPTSPIDFEGEIQKTVKGPPNLVDVPTELDAALTRARVVADAESTPTLLTVNKGKMVVLTETPSGVIRDVLSFKHEPIQAKISAALVQRAVKMCDKMAILENCCVFTSGTTLFQVLGNMG